MEVRVRLQTRCCLYTFTCFYFGLSTVPEHRTGATRARETHNNESEGSGFLVNFSFPRPVILLDKEQVSKYLVAPTVFLEGIKGISKLTVWELAV